MAEKISNTELMIRELAKKLQETRNWLEKLGAVLNLEVSEPVGEWVKKEKMDALRSALAELKKNPR